MPPKTIRNIGIIAHIDAGKTTVSERFLYYAGKEHRMGEVHEGTARMDWREEEQERGITITSAATTLEWGKAQINLIDTPGHVDFTAEVERSLRVLDGAIGVFCGVAGVEAQSETVWRQADTYQVPRIAFVNKLDRVGADFFRVVEDIGTNLNCTTLPMVIPIGSEGEFEGVVDLVRMKALRFPEDQLGSEVVESEVEGELAELAEMARGELLEQVADRSEELMEAYLEGEEIPEDKIREVIREGTLERVWVPVFAGSAFRNKGVQPLLDAVVAYLPAPEDLKSVTGTHPKTEKPVERALDGKAPAAGLVFKIQVDQHGELYYMRVYSGSIKRGGSYLNPRTEKRERLATIYQMHANQRKALEEAKAGDIVAVTGLRFTATGDTLCDQKDPVSLESLEFPETVISMAIEPRSSGERDKLLDQLDRLTREDPTLKLHTDHDTGQVILSGMGELHLEVTKNRLVRDFKLDAKIGKPRVSYRQAFLQGARKRARVERQLGGKDQLGEIDLEVVLDEEQRSVVLEWPDGVSIHPDWRTSVEETVMTCANSGGELGFPYVNARIAIRVPEVLPETTEVGLALAVQEAFEEVQAAAKSAMLWPLMRFQITTPEEYFGSINQDLVRKGAVVDNVDTVHGQRRLTGTVPLEEVFGYTTVLRSLSQGRANMSLEPVGYAPVPASVEERFRF